MQIVKQAAAIQLCDANGSAKSIIGWGCKCNLDNCQRHAFKDYGQFCSYIFQRCRKEQ